MSRNQSAKPSFFRILSDLIFSGQGNQKGFSLAEVMVAAGMLGIISLGITQLMQNSVKTEKRLSQSVNLISLDARVREALYNTVACERTFGIPAPDMSQPLFAAAGAPSAVSNPSSPLAIPNTAKAIYGGNNPGSPVSTWSKVIEQYDSSTGRGVYGSGSNTVYVKSIKYYGYLTPTPAGGLAVSSNYNSSSRTPIPGTNALTDGPHYYGDIVVYVDFRRGNPATYEALASDTERAKKARNAVSGSFRASRFYTISVRTNNSNKIVDCYPKNQDTLEAYCTSIGGYLDPATGKCTNIKINNSSTASDNWAITANTQGAAANQRANVLVEGGLNVGGVLASATPPAAGDVEVTGNIYTGANAAALPLSAGYAALTKGNIKATGDIIAGRDLQVTTEFRSDNNALFKGKVNMGPNAIDTSNYLLKVTSSSANDKVIFNGGSGATDSILEVNNTLNSNGIVQVNNMAATPFRILEGTNLVFKVKDNGNVLFYNGSGGGTKTAQITSTGEIDIFQGAGAVTSVGTGTVGSSYRPIVIKNQPLTLSDDTLWKFTDTSYMATEVPTKAWVKRYIFRGYSEAAIADVLDNILEYAQHNKLDAIKSAMCSSMQLRWKSGTNSTGSGVPAPSTCAWNNIVKKCHCEPVNCSDDATPGATGTIKACNDMFLRGKLDVNGQINSHSNISATGSIFAQNIVQGANIIGTTDVSSPKIHTDNIGVGSVGSNTIYGTHLQAQTDACIDSGGCTTRFGSQMCPYQEVMVGVAYGKVICARVEP